MHERGRCVAGRSNLITTCCILELQDRALAAWECMKDYLHDNYSNLLNRCSFADFMSYCQDATRPQIEASVSAIVRMQDSEDSDAEAEHL